MARQTSHPSSIADRIRDDIVFGAIPFGARLTIAQLSDRYATSHMPVREALRQLAGEGVVVTEPNRGARVRRIDEPFVGQMMDLRAGIEAHLARRAADRAAAQDIPGLERIQDGLEDRFRAHDYEGVLDANREFHTHVNAIARSEEAAGNIDRAWFLLGALWQRFGYGADRFEGVVNDHRHLIAALAENDSQAAEMIMGAHVMKSKQVLIRQMRTTGAATPHRDSAAMPVPQLS